MGDFNSSHEEATSLETKFGLKKVDLSVREKGTRVDNENRWSTLDITYTNVKAKESTTLFNYSTSDHVPV